MTDRGEGESAAAHGSIDDVMELQVFRGADPARVRPLLEGCPVRELGRGEVLLHPGARNSILFVLISGRLSVHLASPEEKPLTRIVPGECAGELSVVSGEPVTAYVLAEEPCRLLAVTQSLLWRLVDASYVIARNLLVILSMRVRLSNNAVMDAECRGRVFEQYARSDTLTGVYNRRHLDGLLEELAARLATGGEGFSLAMLDIDHFKEYNDTHGHPGGDAALSSLGRLLDGAVRCVDTVTRYGGEEFAVVMPGIGVAEAAGIAEAVRAAVSGMAIVHCDGRTLPPVTVSIGVCEAVPGMGPAEVVAAADAALYEAKRGGRNRVRRAEP